MLSKVNVVILTCSSSDCGNSDKSISDSSLDMILCTPSSGMSIEALNWVFGATSGDSCDCAIFCLMSDINFWVSGSETKSE